MKMPSLSIIVPAYQEAATLQGAYQTIVYAVKKTSIIDYEILIVTDDSDGPDGTYGLAVSIAKTDDHVRILHRPLNTTLGYKYREAVLEATKEHITMIPAHDLTEASSVAYIFTKIGQADSILTYTVNPMVRPFLVRIVSFCFTLLCNVIFGLRLRYYNGITVHRANILKTVPMSANNNAYMAEILAYLITSGVGYIEVPQMIKRSNRKGRAFNLKSAWSCLGTLLVTAWRIRVQKKRVDLSRH